MAGRSLTSRTLSFQRDDYLLYVKVSTNLTVSLTELAQVRGRVGLPPECDRHFRADKPLSAYAEAAQANGAIAT
jgi:hypothetical protein